MARSWTWNFIALYCDGLYNEPSRWIKAKSKKKEGNIDQINPQINHRKQKQKLGMERENQYGLVNTNFPIRWWSDKAKIRSKGRTRWGEMGFRGASQRILGFPALSRPATRIRAFRSPRRNENLRLKSMPSVAADLDASVRPRWFQIQAVEP